jgi:DNA-binding NarL/FixJ family response regulator
MRASADILRVLLVGDDPLARGGLARLLAREPLVAVTGEVGARDDFAAALAEHRPDAAAFDLGPATGAAASAGLDRLRALARLPPPVLALVAAPDVAAPARAAGARGLLGRDADGKRLGAALSALARGLIVLDESLEAALGRPRRADGRAPALDGAAALTAREREVLGLLALGLANKEIARRLGVSDHTAKFHVDAILGKLGVHGRTEAVVRAAQLGLVAL